MLCNRKSAKEIVGFHKTKRAQFTTSKRNRMCTSLMAPLMILRKAEKFTWAQWHQGHCAGRGPPRPHQQGPQQGCEVYRQEDRCFWGIVWKVKEDLRYKSYAMRRGLFLSQTAKARWVEKAKNSSPDSNTPPALISWFFSQLKRISH